MSAMPHLVKWNDELSKKGLVIIGAHCQNAPPATIKAKAESKGVNFAIFDGMSVKGGDDFSGIPHCMLFDDSGKCLFRGHPLEVEKLLRTAVNNVKGNMAAELANSVSGAFDTPPKSKAVAGLIDGLKKGQSAQATLQKAVPLLKSTDEVTAAEAKVVVDKLTESGKKKVEEAEAVLKSDPVKAYGLLEKVPADFKGTPIAARAEELLTALRQDEAVKAEIPARAKLEEIKKAEAAFTVKDPTDAKFKSGNATQLSRMRTALQLMKKSWPDAKATAEATTIGEKYGVTVK